MLHTIEKIEAYHLLPYNRLLTHGDNRRAVEGETISVAGSIELGKWGLHGSRRIVDALKNAPRSSVILCKVEIWGDVKEGGDALCGRYRKVLWMRDVCEELNEFYRWCIKRALIIEKEYYSGKPYSSSIEYSNNNIKCSDSIIQAVVRIIRDMNGIISSDDFYAENYYTENEKQEDKILNIINEHECKRKRMFIEDHFT